MSTLIFKDRADFESRASLDDNGVIQECLDILYNGSLEEYESENTGNTGCFNLVQCTDCKDCIECSSSSGLINSEDCIDCTNSEGLSDCSNCEDSSMLESSKNMTRCTDCKGCNYCIESEGLVDESFVSGSEVSEKEEDADSASNSSQVGIFEGVTGNSIDPLGNLDNTGL